MPQFISPEAQLLLRSLFKRNPANRLGKSLSPFFNIVSALNANATNMLININIKYAVLIDLLIRSRVVDLKNTF